MSLLKKAKLFVKIFNETRARNESLRDPKGYAERIRLKMEYGEVPNTWTDIRDYFSDPNEVYLRRICWELQKLNRNLTK